MSQAAMRVHVATAMLVSRASQWVSRAVCCMSRTRHVGGWLPPADTQRERDPTPRKTRTSKEGRTGTPARQFTAGGGKAVTMGKLGITGARPGRAVQYGRCTPENFAPLHRQSRKRSEGGPKRQTVKGKIDDLREGGRYDAALRLVVVALGPHEALAEDVRDWRAECGRLDCVRSNDAIADGGRKSKSVSGS